MALKDTLQKLLLAAIVLLPSSAVAQTYPCSTNYAHLKEGTPLGNGLFILSAKSEDIKALKIFYKGSVHPCGFIPLSEAKKAASNRDDLLVFECGPYKFGTMIAPKRISMKRTIEFTYNTLEAFHGLFFITKQGIAVGMEKLADADYAAIKDPVTGKKYKNPSCTLSPNRENPKELTYKRENLSIWQIRGNGAKVAIYKDLQVFKYDLGPLDF